MTLVLISGILLSIFTFSSGYGNQSSSFRRRAFLKKSSVAVTGVAVSIFPPFLSTNDAAAATAATTTTTFLGSPPMIQQWPNIQYLVPIYTMNSFLSVLSAQLSVSKGSTGLRTASGLVDQFFSGGFLSKKNIFRGLCVIYIQEIKYDDPDNERINIDRMERLEDCDKILNALESMKKPLSKLVSEDAQIASTEVLGYLEDAQAGATNFLSKVPKDDLQKVATWIKVVETADVNHNGNLDNEEVQTLNKEDRDLYDLVGELLG